LRATYGGDNSDDESERGTNDFQVARVLVTEVRVSVNERAREELKEAKSEVEEYKAREVRLMRRKSR